MAQQRQFVNLEDGRVVMVRYDESVRSYCAQAREEYRPSGPALYRVAGSDIWRENSAATALRQYQLPEEHRAIVAQAPASANTSSSLAQTATRQKLMELRSRLLADAGRYSLPPAPTRPQPSRGVSPRAMIEAFYRNAEGLVIGELLTSPGSKVFLIENMATLAKNGVKTLYLEHLRTDIEQSHLDHFHKTGIMSSELDTHLRVLGTVYGSSSPGFYSYYRLVTTAQTHGIRVQALDCAASYSLSKDERARTDHGRVMVQHANQVIHADRLNGAGGKWIALLDNQNANGRHSALAPGLAMAQGVIGLQVEDVVIGPAVETLIPVTASSTHTNFIHADLTLSVKVPWNVSFEASPRFRDLLNPEIREKRGVMLMDPGNTTSSVNRNIRSEFFRRKALLEKTAQAFFSHIQVIPGQRPVPQLPAESPAAQFLEKIYENSHGLVLGAVAKSISARKLLIDNMPVLSRLKVQRLYIQHLMKDFDQQLLDDFHTQGVMPDELTNLLRNEDNKASIDPKGKYSLRQLLVSARQQGIRIQALDTAISYPEGRRAQDPDPAWSPSPRRLPTFNYIAHKLISADQQQYGAHRWLALVESIHVNTLREIPGLAELQGAVGLRTVATGGQPALRITPDSGEVALFSNGVHQVRADLKLEISIQSTPLRPTQRNPRECLHKPSDFLIETTDEGFMLVQKPKDSPYRETPLIASEGLFLAPAGSGIPDSERFSSIGDLVWRLKSTGMVQVAGTPGGLPGTLRLDTHPQLNRPGMFLFGQVENGPYWSIAQRIVH
ncbi:membrane-targeted effector domain-containing toxin [Pseudomonas batumici]|uniref:membrane-targeted effector domain-containing toxin n=1 Tax=Pseudomonas batumici TaxID=226910 RepID=UPI0030D221AC